MSAQEPNVTSIQVRRAVRGERDALGWLVGHLDPLLRAQVRMRLGVRNHADVEDVVAEVWAIVLQRLDDLRPRDGRFAPTFIAFLSTTALNLCNAQLRRRARALASGVDPVGETSRAGAIERLADPTRGVVTRVDGRDVRELIEEVLQRMSADRRDVLALRLLDQRSNRAVAEQLGVPPNTVAVRYRRALLEMRERLPRGVYEGLRDLTFGSAAGEAVE